jgi:multicomponent Na+:H+ antiporter subunit A
MTTTLLVLFFAAAALAMAWRLHLGRWSALVLATPMAVAAVALATRVPDVLDGKYRTEQFEWITSLGIGFVFRVDGYGVLLGLIVTVIGVCIAAYMASYFDDGADVARIAGPMAAFAGSMLGLVLADDIFTLFVFWELTSVTSFLLIGFDDRVPAAIKAAQKALLVTGAGGIVLLGGLILLAQQAGTSRISELVELRPEGNLVNVALVLVLIGAFSKSAQFPLHFWLPGAMKAPTPISAYLHSATMVKAGVVLIARLAPGFAEAPPWRPMIVVVGGITMLLGGARALRQHDVKLLLAHGTVSQLGLLVILAGFGTSATTFAGVAMLTAHALFKAPLFLIVGVVDHSTGSRDIRQLGGLRHQMPVVATLAALAAGSMAAIPPLLGFPAKEKALDALVTAEPTSWAFIATAFVTIGSILTVAYTARWWFGLFADRAPIDRERQPTTADHHFHAPNAWFVAPAALLSVACLVGGLASDWFGDRLAAIAGSLNPASAEKHLPLWAGFNTAVVLSAVALGGGALVFLAGRWIEARTPRRLPSADVIYQRAYDGLLSGASRLTAVVQNGSLPAYSGVVFLTLSALLIAAMALGAAPGDGSVVIADSPVQLALAVLIALLAIGVTMARRRFTAALLLGAAGTFLALIFLLWGAPDLALTQVLVETLALVVLLLVLRHLPDRFRPEAGWAPQWARVSIAATVGVLVTAFAWIASTSRIAPSAASEYADRALSEAGGKNVVNVILVDFRATDTLGEIAVLALAAAGVANLVRAARRAQRLGGDPTTPVGDGGSP